MGVVATKTLLYVQTFMQEPGVFVVEPPLSLPDEARTEFEREFVEAGKPIFRGRWKHAAGV